MTQLDTKYKLALSLKELLKTKALEKITINDIVSQCGLTRQTFYRNFTDKYALVNWYFERLVENSFLVMNQNKTLLEALERKFSFILEELLFFREAFKSQSHESLVEFDYRYILRFYTDIIERKTGAPIEEDLLFTLQLYCRGSIHQTVAWVFDNKRSSTTRIAKQLQDAMPVQLQEMLKSFD